MVFIHYLLSSLQYLKLSHFPSLIFPCLSISPLPFHPLQQYCGFQKDPPRLSLSPVLLPSVGLGIIPPIAPTVWSILALYLVLTVVNLNMPSHAH